MEAGRGEVKRTDADIKNLFVYNNALNVVVIQRVFLMNLEKGPRRELDPRPTHYECVQEICIRLSTNRRC